jgi:lipopolysaccharide biosynthesis glycosyltransferase
MKNIDNTYHIGCSTDDNYVHHASVMICSLLENNRENNIVVHLLHDVLSQENVDFLTSLVHRYGAGIVFHKVDVRRLAGVKFRTHRPLSMAAYYRLLLSSVLDGLDKVLYLDVDTAVLGNVKPLFDLEMDGYALAAVKDVVPCFDDHRASLSIPYDSDYFCSAVMLVNLKYWREHDAEESLIEFAKRDRVVYCHDQDALNYVFRNCWYQLPPKWNRFNMNYMRARDFRDYKDRFEYWRRPAIIHFSDYKPELNCIGIKCADIYRKYYILSGCTALKPVKAGIGRRLKPLSSYIFRTALKCLGLYDAYLYRRLRLRDRLGKVK